MPGRESPQRRCADADLNGIDYIDIGGDDHPQDQSVLVIHFLDKAPEDITIANLRIDGGRRIRDVRVETILEHKQPPSRRLADRLTLRVNHPGDFSPYTLSIVEADDQGLPGDQPLSGFDPRYFQAEFSFKVNCPSDLDCAQNKSCDRCLRPSRRSTISAKTMRVSVNSSSIAFP